METLTVNLFVWVVLFGSGIAARNGAHLGLSILTDRSFFLRKLSIIVGVLASTIFYSLTSWFSLVIMRAQILKGQMSATLNIPEWILMVSMPVGCFLLTLRFIEMGILEFKKGK
jgi:C4-dicarboxylate transporter DctQ subunit